MSTGIGELRALRGRGIGAHVDNRDARAAIADAVEHGARHRLAADRPGERAAAAVAARIDERAGDGRPPVEAGQATDRAADRVLRRRRVRELGEQRLAGGGRGERGVVEHGALRSSRRRRGAGLHRILAHVAGDQEDNQT